MLCFQAVQRQTVANETRERALKMLGVSLRETPVKELATLTGEMYFLIALSKELGRPLGDLLDTLWSSDVTEYRAANLISLAQMEVSEEFAERERKARERKGRGRRRR